MEEISVLIVDDSAAVRRVYRQLLEDEPGIEVIGAAVDPYDAAAKMRGALPDVLLLDIELPRMDGLTFLAKIMAQKPMPVVICSSHTEAGSEAAMKALERGACEVIGKPRMATPQAREEAQIRLADAIRAAMHAGRARGYIQRQPRPAKPPAARPAGKLVSPKLTADAVLPPPHPGRRPPAGLPPLVAIGTSTGGTEALAEVLPGLPRHAPPVVVVQHMPEHFTATFARRLDAMCAVEVREAQSGDVPRPGLVLIAPGDRHMLLQRRGQGYTIEVTDGPYVCRHRPSVDVLLRSVAIAAGEAAFGIVLTGMGDDGARGLKEMQEAGAATFVQDEATSVVWGMPGEAFRLGAARRAVPLKNIAGEITQFGNRSRVA
ncbi:protein-glutamate methylesterase/protein-glutamine glutaminase [Pseudoroseicyclus tamaricis]|nr:chemotaxis response regulator protein-glutamate methylesterase [Pseudoroseicyclus tamaricis]